MVIGKFEDLPRFFFLFFLTNSGQKIVYNAPFEKSLYRCAGSIFMRGRSNERKYKFESVFEETKKA